MEETFNQRLTRFGLGLSAFATLVVLLWPSDLSSIDKSLGLAALTAFTLWLVAELRSVLRRQAHPHDVKFVRELRRKITLESIRYLRQQDFGAAYENDRLDPFWKIDFEGRTDGYGPYDKKLKHYFSNFLTDLRQFGTHLHAHCGPIRSNSPLFAIVPAIERASDEFSDATTLIVNKANALADEVVDRYNEFITEAQKRVPEAFAEEEA